MHFHMVFFFFFYSFPFGVIFTILVFTYKNRKKYFQKLIQIHKKQEVDICYACEHYYNTHVWLNFRLTLCYTFHNKNRVVYIPMLKETRTVNQWLHYNWESFCYYVKYLCSTSILHNFFLYFKACI